MRLSLNRLGVLAFAFTLAACGRGHFVPASSPSSSPSTDNGALDGAEPVVDSPRITPAPDSGVTSIELHQKRYPLKDTHTKLVDNSGNGFESLYGTRNVRTVLNGVVYRGGANNTNNKFGKRDNRNPLPTVGINNLCKEGFSAGVYLYPTNYASAPHSVNCQTLTGSVSQMPYLSLNPTTESGINAIFDLVQKSLNNPNNGPVYLHCWNGWHASGLASALVLRQFCGMSADAAVAYWDLNTDGAPVDSTYTSLRNRIRTFVPRSQYQISASMKRAVCPQ